jgi:hypothetical protein
MMPYDYQLRGSLLTDATADGNWPVPPFTQAEIDEKGVQIAAQNIKEDIFPSNPNVEVGAIFDAQSGVFWNIGGTCPEEYFEKSFWGILGFTYDQYNPKVLSDDNGRQARVGTNNMFNIELATTNCQVVSTELKQYPMNVWGNNKYRQR